MANGDVVHVIIGLLAIKRFETSHLSFGALKVGLIFCGEIHLQFDLNSGTDDALLVIHFTLGVGAAFPGNGGGVPTEILEQRIAPGPHPCLIEGAKTVEYWQADHVTIGAIPLIIEAFTNFQKKIEVFFLPCRMVSGEMFRVVFDEFD